MAQIQDAVGNPILANVLASGTPIALNDEVSLALNGQAGAAFQIAGIGPETYSFEGTVDGTNWFALSGTRLSDGTVATSTNANGIWSFVTAGLLEIRLRLSAGAPGTATVTGICGQGAGLPPFGGSVAIVGPVTVVEPVSVDDNAGSLTVDDGGGSLTVDGAVVAMITDGVDTAAVTAAGALVVDGSGVTQPISAAALPLPTGAATSALQTQPGVDIGDVTVNNAAGAGAVNVQDGGNSITIDGSVSITGTPTVDTELPAAAAMADAAANPTAPAVDARGSVYNGATWDRLRGNTSGVQAQGSVAHDAPAAGNPVMIGGQASTDEPTAVAVADAVRAWLDLHGRLVVLDGHANPEAPVSLNATASGNTTVVAAPGGGISIHVKKASVHNRAGTTRVVALTDGAGGTVRWRAELGVNGGGSIIDFGSHGWALTAATALVVNLDAAGDVDVNITEYYLAP